MKKFSSYIIFLSTFFCANFLHAQTVNKPYDVIVSGYHGSIAKTNDGGFKVWGNTMSNTGTNLLSPLDLNSTNFPNLTGTPLKATLGGTSSSGNDQQVVLTSTGLFAWGPEGKLLDNSFTTSTTLNFPVITGASTSDGSKGLPVGISPSDVEMLHGMNGTLVLLTKNDNANVYRDGEVWVLTIINKGYEANGASGATSSDGWVKVKMDASTYLTGITAVRGQISDGTITNGGAIMALKYNGDIYTWGFNVYLGGNLIAQSKYYATKMTLPTEFNSSNIPKMIAVTGGTKGTSGVKPSFFVLSNNGTLYSLGYNAQHQLGDWTTTERTQWVTARSTSSSGPNLNVSFISASEHGSYYPAVAAITNVGKLYVWGQENGYDLGRGNTNTTSLDPGIPSGAGDGGEQVVNVEVGGHTLAMQKVGSYAFCYVGHRVNGSMGCGACTDNSDVTTFNCDGTPSFAIVGTVPIAASATSSTIAVDNSTICLNGTSKANITISLKKSNGDALGFTGGIVTITPSGSISSSVTIKDFSNGYLVNNNDNGNYTASISSTQAGTITLTFAINGTTASQTTSITFVALPGTISSTKTAIDCTHPTASITVTSPIGAGYSYSTDGNTYTSSTSFTGLNAGDITVYVKNASGCYTSTIVNIPAGSSSIITPIVQVTQPTWCSASGTISITNAQAGYTYSIDGITYTSTTIFTGISPNNYNVKAFNGSCYSNNVPVSIMGFVLNADLVLPTCAITTGSVSVTTSLGANITFSLVGSSTYTNTTGLFNSVPAGNYTLTATNASNCSITKLVSLPLLNVPAPPTSILTQPICDNSFGVVAISSPINSNYQYSKDHSDFVDGNFSTSPNWNLLAGSYPISVKDITSGCISTIKIEVLASTPPTITVSSPLCVGSSFTLSAPNNGDNTFSWSGPSAYTSTSTTITRSVAGTYTLTVTSGDLSCILTASTNISLNSVPTAPTYSSIQPTCLITTGTISITNKISNITYTILTNSNNYTNTTGIFSDVGAGTYSVTATNASGCSTYSSTSITLTNPKPDVPSGSSSQTFCSSESPTIGSLIVTGSSIKWYSVSTGGSPLSNGSSISSGNYFASQTANSCESNRFAVAVTLNTTPSIATTTPNGNCGSGSITLGATSSAGTVNWYSGLTGGSSISTGTSYITPSISSNTTYYVDATDNGCTTVTRSSVLATIKALPTITATNPNSRCGTGVILLGATASAGIINWYTSLSGESSISTGSSYTTTSISSTTTYYVDVTDNGCTSISRSSILATVNPAVSISISGNTTDYDKVSITASGGSTYKWTGGASPNSASNIFRKTGYYGLIVTDVNGCKGNNNYFIQIKLIGVTRQGKITDDSTLQVNLNGRIASKNPIAHFGKKRSYGNDGSTSESAGQSAFQIKRDFPESIDGYYWIQNENINGGAPFQIYADMTTDGGGWTLILCNASFNGWNTTNAVLYNQTVPSINSNYSILQWADYIKSASRGFQYMLDANSRGSFGGIWTSNDDYSFVKRDNSQTNVSRTSKFGLWADDNDGGGVIENRMPWWTNNSGEGIITTSPSGTGHWWGTLVSLSNGWIPSPWLEISDSNGSNPGIIWYWVR